MLEARQLSAERGERLLFSQRSLSLAAGQALWLRGANGSGKTTLLRILAGLHRPLSGEVRWNGQSLATNQPLASYLGHRNGLKEELTPRENLDHALACLPAQQNRLDVDVALAKVGLDALGAELPCRLLSQGQQRRVALARLLTEARPLWLLDEPFVGLDHKAVTSFMDQLRQHLQQGGVLVITTHQPLDGSALQTSVSELQLDGKA